MATLSLKKPRQIGTTPLHEFDGQFVVMRHARHEKSLRFTCVHKTLELASKEAKRLAMRSKSERFLVLQIVESVDWSE
jgi:hypothetical protein